MVVLGIDYGDKNIGTAVGYRDTGITNTLEVIKRTKDQREFSLLLALIKQWQVQTVVLGLPLDSEGKETPACRKIRSFARGLQLKSEIENLSFEIDYVSEQDSTKRSNQGLSRTQKKTKGDAYAAEYILKQYLSS